MGSSDELGEGWESLPGEKTPGGPDQGTSSVTESESMELSPIWNNTPSDASPSDPSAVECGHHVLSKNTPDHESLSEGGQLQQKQPMTWFQQLANIAARTKEKLSVPGQVVGQGYEKLVETKDPDLRDDNQDQMEQDVLLPSSTMNSNAEDSAELQKLQQQQQDEEIRFSWIKFIKFCGSGLLMSVSFLDPGNLEADIQVGVQTGYDLLWWYFICAVLFGFAFQCLAGQIGLVTGQDLAQHCGSRYPKPARILLWILLEIAIVGADIQETIGSAIALAILTNGLIPLWAGCILISVTAFLLLLLDGLGYRQLEMVFGIFIAVEAVALGMNFVEAEVPTSDLARGLFIPSLTTRSLPVAVGALGALVMPYNIFFQSSIVNSRPRGNDTDAKTSMLIRYMRLENLIMLIMAFLINLFVVCVFAKGFYAPDSEQEISIGLETAGFHLAEAYGASFQTVWAVGLLASGQVATISLTYAGQLVMTGLLGMKVRAGMRMIATRLVALVPTVIMAVVFEASNTFDFAAQLLNVAQSILLPFALLPVLHIGCNKKIMGERFAAGRFWTAVTVAITVAVLAVNAYLLYDVIKQQAQDGLSPGWIAGMVVSMVVYYGMALYYAVGPENVPQAWSQGKTFVRKAWARLPCRTRRADYESMLEVHW